MAGRTVQELSDLSGKVALVTGLAKLWPKQTPAS